MPFELTLGELRITSPDVVCLDTFWDRLKRTVDFYLNEYRESKANQFSTAISPSTWTATGITSGNLFTVKVGDTQKDELDKLIKQRDENNKSLTKPWNKGKKRKPKK